MVELERRSKQVRLERGCDPSRHKTGVGKRRSLLSWPCLPYPSVETCAHLSGGGLVRVWCRCSGAFSVRGPRLVGFKVRYHSAGIKSCGGPDAHEVFTYMSLRTRPGCCPPLSVRLARGSATVLVGFRRISRSHSCARVQMSCRQQVSELHLKLGEVESRNARLQADLRRAQQSHVTGQSPLPSRCLSRETMEPGWG